MNLNTVTNLMRETMTSILSSPLTNPLTSNSTHPTTNQSNQTTNGPLNHNIEISTDESNENEEHEYGHHNDNNRCPYTVKGNHEPNTVMKDNDLKYKIKLSYNIANNLLFQLKKDAEFLYSIDVMDFSLLGELR